MSTYLVNHCAVSNEPTDCCYGGGIAGRDHQGLIPVCHTGPIPAACPEMTIHVLPTSECAPEAEPSRTAAMPQAPQLASAIVEAMSAFHDLVSRSLGFLAAHNGRMPILLLLLPGSVLLLLPGVRPAPPIAGSPEHLFLGNLFVGKLHRLHFTATQSRTSAELALAPGS